MNDAPITKVDEANDVRPSRMRFSLTTMIVTISLACLVMGNIISTGKWYFETRALKRELAIAERTTGYLVVDDPTKIQVTNVGAIGKGTWRFRFHLPEGYNYRLCHQIGEIPEHGTPQQVSKRNISQMTPGEVELMVQISKSNNGFLDLDIGGRFRGHRKVSGAGGTYSQRGDWGWWEARPILGSSSKVRYRTDSANGSTPVRYYLVDIQGLPNTSNVGHLSYEPTERFDLIKIRSVEIQGPEKVPTSGPFGLFDPFDPFKIDTKALEQNNEIPEISDGIQLWIESVPIP